MADFSSYPDNFQQNPAFLREVLAIHAKEYYTQITTRDFMNESHVLRVVTGKITAGSISISSTSSTRRTGSLTCIFDAETARIINTDNIISIDKKLGISIGITNPFYERTDNPLYAPYADLDILWFKQGVFIVTGASSTLNASGSTITFQFIDKMGKLNGTSGGTLPATVVFHEQSIVAPNGDTTIEYPLIKDILHECVHHFGDENYDKIFIEDVEDVGRQVVAYNSDTPLWFDDLQQPKQFRRSSTSPGAGWYGPYIKGQLVGYKETPLTYPGELIQKGGTGVEGVIKAIADMLGSYEYYYDVEGNFHFRRNPNFVGTGFPPLIQAKTDGSSMTDPAGFQDQYLKKFSNYKYIGELGNLDYVTSVSFAPKYDNIKNDFIVWGSRKDGDTERVVRYHLCIDEQPKDTKTSLAARDTALHYLEFGSALCYKWLVAVRRDNPGAADDNTLLRYQVYMDGTTILHPTLHPTWFTATSYTTALGTRTFYVPKPLNTSALNLGEKWDVTMFAPALQDIMPVVIVDGKETYPYSFDWREELYRMALVNYGSSTRGSYYDEELMAEWRNNYDPTNVDGMDSFLQVWEGSFTGSTWTGYNPDTVLNPKNIVYWLDIIDSSAAIGKYGCNRIGRRTFVEENTSINECYPISNLDVVYFDITGLTAAEIQAKQDYYNHMGQNFMKLKTDQLDWFLPTNSFGTCFEIVRQRMSEHLNYNASITLTTIPILYYDVNQVIRLNIPEQEIYGDYVITSISYSFGNITTMSIQATEVIATI